MTVTDTVRLNVLKHLVNDRSIAFVAQAMRITEEQVRRIAQDHGYPDRDKLAWAVDVLKGKIDQADAIPEATPEQVARHSRAGVQQIRSAPAERVAVARQDPAPAAPAEPGINSYEVLLRAARLSKRKGTRTAAERVAAQVEKLRELVDGEAAAAAEKKRLDAEREAARQEVAELERKLAAARKKVAGPKRGARSTPSDGPNAADVRAWADANSVDCPTRGRVPAVVREAYDAAHEAGVA